MSFYFCLGKWLQPAFNRKHSNKGENGLSPSSSKKTVKSLKTVPSRYYNYLSDSYVDALTNPESIINCSENEQEKISQAHSMKIGLAQSIILVSLFET